MATTLLQSPALLPIVLVGQFKQNVGAYAARARQGNVFFICSRDWLVAVLGPPVRHKRPLRTFAEVRRLSIDTDLPVALYEHGKVVAELRAPKHAEVQAARTQRKLLKQPCVDD